MGGYMTSPEMSFTLDVGVSVGLVSCRDSRGRLFLASWAIVGVLLVVTAVVHTQVGRFSILVCVGVIGKRVAP